MRKKLLAGFLALTLGLIMMFNNSVNGVRITNVYADTESEIEKAKQDKEAEQKRLEQIQQNLSSLKAKSADTEAYIKELDGQMVNLDKQLYDLGREIEQLGIDIEQLNKDLEQAQQVKEEQYEMMKLRIKFMYEHNSESYLAMLLSSANLGEMLNKAEYVSKISEYDRQALEKYQQSVVAVVSATNQLTENVNLLNEKKDTLLIQRSQLLAFQQEKQNEMSNLNSLLIQAQNEETESKESIARQDSLIASKEKELEEERKKAAAAGTSGGYYSGQFAGAFLWPVDSTRITQEYNWEHNGVDIGARTPGVWGDYVYAAADGVCVFTGYDPSCGNWMWIDHGSGVYSIYMHLSAFNVGVGTSVSRGQTIALMGSTGYSTGPHLHFSVRINGEYVNPWTYLR